MVSQFFFFGCVISMGFQWPCIIWLVTKVNPHPPMVKWSPLTSWTVRLKPITELSPIKLDCFVDIPSCCIGIRLFSWIQKWPFDAQGSWTRPGVQDLNPMTLLGLRLVQVLKPDQVSKLDPDPKPLTFFYRLGLITTYSTRYLLQLSNLTSHYGRMVWPTGRRVMPREGPVQGPSQERAWPTEIFEKPM